MSDCDRTGHHWVVTGRTKEGDVIVVSYGCRWCPATREDREPT